MQKSGIKQKDLIKMDAKGTRIILKKLKNGTMNT